MYNDNHNNISIIIIIIIIIIINQLDLNLSNVKSDDWSDFKKAIVKGATKLQTKVIFVFASKIGKNTTILKLLF